MPVPDQANLASHAAAVAPLHKPHGQHAPAIATAQRRRPLPMQGAQPVVTDSDGDGG